MLGPLIALGLILAAGAYLLLDAHGDAVLDDRFETRTSDVVRLVAPALDDQAQIADAGFAAVRLEGVRSVAVANIDRRSIVAGATDDPDTENEAARALREMLAGLEAMTGPNADVQYRPVLSYDFASNRFREPYVVAVQLDRDIIAGDLNGNLARSMAAMAGTLSLLLITAYLLIRWRISRPLESLASRVDWSLDPQSHGRIAWLSSDPIVRLERRIERLLAVSRTVDSPAVYRSPLATEALPEVWLRFDAGLKVVDARLEDETVLDVERLSDMFAEDVVRCIAGAISGLAAGDIAEFEVVFGQRQYQARLRSAGAEFALHVTSEFRQADLISDSTARAGELLADLLRDLPVGVAEVDDQLRIRYANRPLFGVRAGAGSSIDTVLPSEFAGAFRTALDKARRAERPAQIELAGDSNAPHAATANYVVAIESDGAPTYLLLSVDLSERPVDADSASARELEEQLWAQEVRVADYEERIERLNQELEQSRNAPEVIQQASDAMTDALSEPIAKFLRTVRGLRHTNRSRESGEIDALQAAGRSLAEQFDAVLGTQLLDRVEGATPDSRRRFHLATVLDEIVLESSSAGDTRRSPVSVLVHPSLPKWLYGDELGCRAVLHRMIEFAHLVSAERTLILTAMQGVSSGSDIQVRCEVQIPPPPLGQDNLYLLRGCIDDSAAPIGLAEGTDGVTAMRCSFSFESADEREAEHGWVRGLRTLVIQESQDSGSGIQQALIVFGIIGYVVRNEADLVEALGAAKAYSNPYRLVLVDADTSEIDRFTASLLRGDAPVILIGMASEAAMIEAIANGYAGYLSKPVRQLDLMEVILSTVQPREPAGENPSTSRR